MSFLIKNICCIGAGYVGGPTMAVIADQCHHIQVNVVDLNIEKIKLWNSKDLSKLPVYEPGLAEIVQKRRGKNLHFSTEVNENISKANMIFISVNTPTKNYGIGAGKASNLRWIEESARQISKYSKGNTIIVEKSTIPVRTASTIKQILTKTNNNSDHKNFHVLSNPEFLAEGSAIKDLLNPDRILIGGDNDEAIEALTKIYLNWVKKDKILTTNLWSSELSKLIANAFLAQRVSSINTVSALCEKTGADVDEVSIAVGMDKRIGRDFLKSGPGFGGSCFKKDILNLVYISEYYGLKEVGEYWQKVLEINSWQQKRIYKSIVDNLFNNVAGKKICILGFSFKANTNDTRESPAIEICKDLVNDGSNISIYDPKVSKERIDEELNNALNLQSIHKNHEPPWEVSSNLYDSAKDSDAILILTEWEEFKNLNFQKLSNIMRPPSWIFDTRSIIDNEKANNCGFNIWSVGKKKLLSD